jgi:hypothetical protein
MLMSDSRLRRTEPVERVPGLLHEDPSDGVAQVLQRRGRYVRPRLELWACF